ncbi:MAG TPA: subclass B1 metallo-beta-lactamase [Parvularculaceae bacterium]|nr:subclass B1 metallo-beta-lactamase [Parvularculaceae bacterium]
MFALIAFLLAALGAPNGVEPDNAVPAPSLEKIADHVWVHKSYRNVPSWGLVLSQGLVIDTGEGVLLVDTAWTEEDTQKVLALIKDATGKNPALAIVTHAHSDKMGGMGVLRAAGIPSRADPMTNEDAPKRSLLPADGAILDKGDFEALSASLTPAKAGPVEVFYPGPGHTRDNIVAYYAPARILFGGCLIRPAEATDFGNMADGDVANWANAVRAVKARFPDAKIVVPTHGPAGGPELLDHTIMLAEAAARHADH